MSNMPIITNTNFSTITYGDNQANASVDDPPINKADGLPHGTGGLTQNGAKSCAGGKRYNSVDEMGITLKQMEVLDWLVDWCRTEEKTIPSFYGRITRGLEIKIKAARVHVCALQKKGLIWTEVAYRHPGSRQAIGLKVKITSHALSKYYSHKFITVSKQEAEDFEKKQARALELTRQGYVFDPELNGYVRPPLPRQSMTNPDSQLYVELNPR